MSTTMRVIIFAAVSIIAGAMLLVLAGGFLALQASRSAVDHVTIKDTTHVEQIATEIVDLDVPSGYAPDYAVNVSDFRVASYLGADGHSHLILAQMPSWLHVDVDELRRRAAQSEQGQNPDLRTIEERPVTVRGQKSTLIIQQGVNSDQQDFYLATVVFDGARGQTVLVLEEPTSRWDVERLEALIASVR